MANGDLPAAQGGVPANSGELEMNNWLKKLKENQDMRREERLRKYNDIISKFIIILVGVLVVSFIAIAALAIENNNLYRQNDQLKAQGVQNETQLNDQITKLTNDNRDLREFIFSNRSFNNVEYTVNMDPALPKVSKITFNTNKVHIEFADGSPPKDVYFIDSNLYVNNQ
jgi:cell division protein FtsB